MIEYLYEHKRVSAIGLWGRSMGGVTSLFYMAENPGTVNCAAMDSAFTSLSSVVTNMGGQMGIGPELVEMLLPMIDGAVQQAAGFSII